MSASLFLIQIIFPLLCCIVAVIIHIPQYGIHEGFYRMLSHKKPTYLRHTKKKINHLNDQGKTSSNTEFM